MKRVTLSVLLFALLGVAACGEEAVQLPHATTPHASPEVPDAVAPGTHTRPAAVVRIWLEAAKRGDGEAMSALWAAEKRARVKASPRSFATTVAAGRLHAATWDIGAEAGNGAERTVTAHVLWREHPDGGDNLEFRFVQRDGRWWIVRIAHYD